MDGRFIGEVTIAGMAVVVRELTVKEIRVLMESKVELSGDVVNAFLFEDLTLTDISAMSSLTNEQIDDLAPSQIDRVIAKIKEVNPRFFEMMARIVPLGKAMQASASAQMSELSV